jgi:5-formyltetrahydrofolate cyclo-ligase
MSQRKPSSRRRRGPAAEKALLRARMRERRQAAGAEQGESARAAGERLAALPEVGMARTVMVYLGHGSEISTEPLIERLAVSGRILLVPVVRGDEIQPWAFRPGDPVQPGPYGPSEPVHSAPADPATVDLVVVPGLAFDRSGHRLGQGGGHYDRFLPFLRPDATRVGLCFDTQLLDRVPHEPADEPVDIVVTDRRTVDCRAPA